MEMNKKLPAYYYSGGYFILTIFILGIAAILCKYYIFGIIEISVAAFLFILNLISRSRTEKRLYEMFEKMTLNVGEATRSSLINFPLPTVVADIGGDIKWYNNEFKQIFNKNSLINENIKELIDSLKESDFWEGSKKSILEDVSYEGRYFKIAGSKTIERSDSDKNAVVVLYFYETTDFIKMQKKYMQEKTFECMLFVDNYDEIMETTKNAEIPQVQAQIYKVINDWANESGGVLIKYERDKYCIIFEHKKLDDFIKNKFDILNRVRAIQEGNAVPVTISIGIGVNGANIYENDEFAKNAINMALGRGGDQVVIKDNEHFSYYGGATKEYERSTKVKARVVSVALSGLMDSAENIVVMGHKNADIDCVGAAFGIYRMARLHNKPINIILETYNQTVSAMLSRLENVDEYSGVFINNQQALSKVTENTLLIIVDTHKPSLVENQQILTKTSQIVVIDHHRRAAEFVNSTVLVYHEPYSSSTCEMITEILQYSKDKKELTKLEAECLYAGMILDTKNFTFKTGVRTFEAASFLRKQGVDTVAIKTMFQQDFSSYVKKSAIIKDAEIIKDCIAIGTYVELDSDITTLAAQAADEMLNIRGITASFVLCRSERGTVISGRSLGGINVQVILEKLGGGGHLTIAGAQLENTTLDETLDKLKEAIEDYYNETSN
ncbi:MAG: phosphoesterase [Ruminococcaceae bacterium]|nr:phosphoesterase [Oscillospiraceae bacterium]